MQERLGRNGEQGAKRIAFPTVASDQNPPVTPSILKLVTIVSQSVQFLFALKFLVLSTPHFGSAYYKDSNQPSS